MCTRESTRTCSRSCYLPWPRVPGAPSSIALHTDRQNPLSRAQNKSVLLIGFCLAHRHKPMSRAHYKQHTQRKVAIGSIRGRTPAARTRLPHARIHLHARAASSATKKHAVRHASAPEESDSNETLLVLGEARCRDRAFRNTRGPWRLHSRARARRASVARFRRHDRRHADTPPRYRRRQAAQRTWSARDGGFASPASSSSESSMLSHLE